MSAKLKIGRGVWGGRKIHFKSAEDLRPTLARIREAVFSMLAPYAGKCGFIDLCAGSGIMGFEAASMGFQPVCMLDSNRAVVAQLQENQRLLNAQVTIAGMPAAHLDRLNLPGMAWIVYADPPYRDRDFHVNMLPQLAASPYIAPGSLYVAECHRDSRPEPVEPWTLMKQKRYGRTRIDVFIKD